MLMTYKGDLQEIHSSVRKLELCLAEESSQAVVDFPSVKAYLRNEQITLEFSGMSEEGKKYVLGRTRDEEDAQLEDGTLTRTKVKLMSASFLFRNEELGVEVRRETIFL